MPPAPKKTAPKSQPKPELTYELDGAPPKLFLIWSQNLEMWLAPNGASFTPFIVGAGTFTEARAAELAADQNVGTGLVVKQLVDEVREQLAGANPVVLATIATLGVR